ncbi:quinone oxidoreductase family protein [Deinococcus hopiensis]|uniref:NADPH2:quinone reductase n=1 Tax=Deinococcus hopiensis KR-140 TaxID=695939 RepID=A0A1W1VPI5_9DEIO|nr:quinone oxidoreductase [Deinococcus hopiensis]SMB94981.1 NADPH2:quinone reductase [Deinococcus hopiensis KR-140]
MNALTFSRFGGPEVLEYREVPDPLPTAGEVLVRTQAIGLNFADVYRRQGRYHLAGQPPYIAGYEAAGVVEAVPPGSAFRPGNRVAFADSPYANAELVAVPEDKLIPLPDDISPETAAALLLQGLTAQFLTCDSHAVRAGETVLVQAAAGGVGLLLVQLARAAGARVLGLTSSPVKAEQALEAGANEVRLYPEDWVGAARAFGGEGVDVVYDSVGSTLAQSLEAARVGGHVVFYGMAGGDPPLVDPRMLMDTSRSLTGGDLWNILRTAEDRRSRAASLFDLLRSGALKVRIARTFPLADGAGAHAFLESRQSSGKVLLLP